MSRKKQKQINEGLGKALKAGAKFIGRTAKRGAKAAWNGAKRVANSQ
jgi:hypothetical protein